MPELSNERLKQIEEIQDRINRELAWIEQEKDKAANILEMIQDTANALPEESTNAPSSVTLGRDRGSTRPINQSVDKNRKILEWVNKGIEDREAEVEVLESDKKVLESL